MYGYSRKETCMFPVHHLWHEKMYWQNNQKKKFSTLWQEPSTRENKTPDMDVHQANILMCVHNIRGLEGNLMLLSADITGAVGVTM